MKRVYYFSDFENMRLDTVFSKKALWKQIWSLAFYLFIYLSLIYTLSVSDFRNPAVTSVCSATVDENANLCCCSRLFQPLAVRM